MLIQWAHLLSTLSIFDIINFIAMLLSIIIPALFVIFLSLCSIIRKKVGIYICCEHVKPSTIPNRKISFFFFYLQFIFV